MISCSNSSNHLGALKIVPPKGSFLEQQELDNGVHFYSVKWNNPHAQGALFMISKWPTRMSISKVPYTVKTIIDETVSSLKNSEHTTINEDSQIQYAEITGEFLSGNLASIEYTDKAGNNKILSVHMVSDGNVIWNGQFTGPKELFNESMNMIKSIEPQD